MRDIIKQAERAIVPERDGLFVSDLQQLKAAHNANFGDFYPVILAYQAGYATGAAAAKRDFIQIPRRRAKRKRGKYNGRITNPC